MTTSVHQASPRVSSSSNRSTATITCDMNFDGCCCCHDSTASVTDAHIRRPQKRYFSNDPKSSNINFDQQTSVSILSVPIMDPFYRDLQALQSDHMLLQTKFKLSQQNLQKSYQDLSVAQYQTKSQQLAELQTRLDVEIGSRKALEQEYDALRRENLQIKSKAPRSKNTTAATASFTDSGKGDSPGNSPTTAWSAMSFIPFWKDDMSSNSHYNGGDSHQKSMSNGTNENNASALSPMKNIHKLNSLEKKDGEQKKGGCTIQQGEIETNIHAENTTTLWDAATPTSEQLECQKVFYEKLREENITMERELIDLRYRCKAEKDSVKSYMSLFENLQKKQFNALAVSRSKIDLLRSQSHDLQAALAARDSQIKTLHDTVQSQIVELQVLTCQVSRAQTARAKIEQEMALLIEASLLMLERWFETIQQTRVMLKGHLDPVRQSILHLEEPSILAEWDQCVRNMEYIIDQLAKSLLKQQEFQEIELETGVVPAQDPKAIIPINNSNIKGHESMDQDEDKKMGALSLDNNYSQQIFVWRKFMADTFLENCVKTVENLAQEKRDLQVRLFEQTCNMADGGQQQSCNAAEVDIFNSQTSQSALPAEASSKQEQQQKTQQYEHIGRGKADEVASNEYTLDHGAKDTIGWEGAQNGVKNVTAVHVQSTIAPEKFDDVMHAKVQRLEAILRRILGWDKCREMRRGDSIEGEILGLGIPGFLPQDALNGDLLQSQMESDMVAINIKPFVTTNLCELNFKQSQEEEELSSIIHCIRSELSDLGTQLPAVSNIEQEKIRKPRTDQSIVYEKANAGSISAIMAQHNLPPFPSSIFLKTSPMSYVPSLGLSDMDRGHSFPLGYVSVNGLKTPVTSPGLSGIGSGPDGEASILDMDAICRDLNFRSFPKRYRWSIFKEKHA
ncbi:hypothetical protein BX616_010672 [Lobosporangium transversale]|nr:hypothetical protein BX616_010672 [Lobosporangium transversale]